MKPADSATAGIIHTGLAHAERYHEKETFMHDLAGRSLKEIGQAYGLTEARIRQRVGRVTKSVAQALVVCVVFVLPAVAIDAVQVPAKNLKVTWSEPTNNADGSALTDLASVIIRGSIDGTAIDDVPVDASGLTGGQTGEHVFLDVCQPNTMPQVDLNLVAVDVNGNESEGAVIVQVMDCLPPGKVK